MQNLKLRSVYKLLAGVTWFCFVKFSSEIRENGRITYLRGAATRRPPAAPPGTGPTTAAPRWRPDASRPRGRAGPRTGTLSQNHRHRCTCLKSKQRNLHESSKFTIHQIKKFKKWFNSSRKQNEVHLPETNLLLTRESLYPGPTSSNSAPDKVVPSQLN